MGKRALVIGWFSTVGDKECLQITSRWLDQLGIPHDVAPYNEKVGMEIPGVYDPRKVDPGVYSHLIVVCGPCWEDLFTRHNIDLSQFSHCIRIGINLTMVNPIEEWNPFDVLIERDSNRTTRPDMTLLEVTSTVPVVGRCLVHKQKVYGERQRHDLAIKKINDFIDQRGLAVIDIDTRWPPVFNTAGQKNPAQVASLIKRVDVLLTNRLHGMVFAIKSGVPVIAIDGIKGGDKVTSQAKAIGWPMVIGAEEATTEWLDRAFDWCLSVEAGERIENCLINSRKQVETIEEDFFSAMTSELKPTPLSVGKKSSPFLERIANRFRTRK